MKLKLKEIVWEITGKCKNGCTYCGSKENWKEEIDEIKVKKIADRVAEYPPKEIDISGGDPLLVSCETHSYIKKVLASTKCKILINPLSMDTKVPSNLEKQHCILQLYDHIGISINTLDELKHFKFLKRKGYFNVPHTVITNYNITNFFLHNKIAEVLKDYNIVWQIQFTIYKEENSPFALYNYPEAIVALNQSIEKYRNIHYIFADNANQGPCIAGIYSIGLLSNGDVVPCLSMRSWVNNIKSRIEGNILSTSLKDIWMNSFQKNRFYDDCICCKDICNKAKLELPNKETDIKLDKLEREITIKGNDINFDQQLTPKFAPYLQPIGVIAYAVFSNPIISDSGILQQISGNDFVF